MTEPPSEADRIVSDTLSAGTANHGEPARGEWLADVRKHPMASERHYEAAEFIAQGPRIPAEHVQAADEMVEWGIVWKRGEKYSVINPATGRSHFSE
jgi:hypothetical protein